MSSTRDFVASTVADGMIPYLRRPVEDIIYETLDQRQVPTRTDFRELRDLVNNLRGQLTGATGGVRKLAEQLEELDERLEGATGSTDGADLSRLQEDVAGLAAALERGTRVAQQVELTAKRLAELEAAHSVRIAALEEQLAELAGTDDRLSALEARLEALGAESNEADSMLQDEITALAEASLEADSALATELAELDADTDVELAEVSRKLEAVSKAASKPAAKSRKKAAPKAAKAPKAATNATNAANVEECKVPDCDREARAKGFCAKHYQRWRRGTLDGFPVDA